MKKSQLKQLIREVVTEYNTYHGEDGELDFTTTVQVDYMKVKFPAKSEGDRAALVAKLKPTENNSNSATFIGWDGCRDLDVDVKVKVAYEWNDQRFDYQFGDEHGTHDPGSGFENTSSTLTLTGTPIFEIDGTGNETKLELVKQGQPVELTWLTPESRKTLDNEVQQELKKRSQEDARPDDEDEDR
jgi:hypothetical protein